MLDESVLIAAAEQSIGVTEHKTPLSVSDWMLVTKFQPIHTNVSIDIFLTKI